MVTIVYLLMMVVLAPISTSSWSRLHQAHDGVLEVNPHAAGAHVLGRRPVLGLELDRAGERVDERGCGLAAVDGLERDTVPGHDQDLGHHRVLGRVDDAVRQPLHNDLLVQVHVDVHHLGHIVDPAHGLEPRRGFAADPLHVAARRDGRHGGSDHRRVRRDVLPLARGPYRPVHPPHLLDVSVQLLDEAVHPPPRQCVYVRHQVQDMSSRMVQNSIFAECSNDYIFETTSFLAKKVNINQAHPDHDPDSDLDVGLERPPVHDRVPDSHEPQVHARADEHDLRPIRDLPPDPVVLPRHVPQREQVLILLHRRHLGRQCVAERGQVRGRRVVYDHLPRRLHVLEYVPDRDHGHVVGLDAEYAKREKMHCGWRIQGSLRAVLAVE